MVAGQQALAGVRARPQAALLRASLVLIGVAAVSKLTTLAADSFVAARFGLSADADAYLLAIGLVAAVLAAPSETVRLAIVPVCGDLFHRGDRRLAAGVVLLLLLAVLVFGGAAALALAAAAPWLASAAAPGFDGAGRDTVVQLVRLLSVAVVLGLAMAVLLGVLHAQLRFGAPALAGIGLGVGVIAFGLLLGDTLGVKSLAVGYVAGTVAVLGLLGWLSADLVRDGAAVRGALPELRPLVRLALPTGIAILIVSAGAVIERAVASATGSGNVAALGFAIKLLTQASVLSQAIWTPLTPLLTASGASGKRAGDPRLLTFSIKLVLLTLVPATALVIALREPLAAVVYQHGTFSAEDTGTTATLLALHSGSLVGEGLFMVAAAALMSFYDAGTRVIAAAVFLISKVALMLALAPVIGAAGIALAASASSLLAGAYVLRVLGRRFAPEESRGLRALAAKVALAGALMLLAAAGLSELAAVLSAGGPMATAIVRLAAGGIAGGAVYGAALAALRVEEATTLLGRARERVAGLLS